MKNLRKEWLWVPPMYFIQGLPNVVVASLAVIFYKTMGMAEGHAVALTSLLYLPWVLKALWGPLVDSISTKRNWILLMFVFFIAAFQTLCVSVFFSAWVAISIVCFWLLSIASATYDIAADGFYMLAMPEKEQAYFVGIRSVAFRAALWFANGVLLVLAGFVYKKFGTHNLSWAVVFELCALISFLVFSIFYFILPKPKADENRNPKSLKILLEEFIFCFLEFFKKPQILSILFYVLFYRFAEAQLAKIVPLFLIANKEDGGLGLSLAESGIAYGSAGLFALILGGILGGILISKFGIKKTILPLALAINLPNIFYVYLAYVQPSALWEISFCVAAEQFGYGLGFAAYLMFLMHSAKGAHRTSHYAISTGFMALGLIIPGFVSGYIKEFLGFQNFFLWACAATLVSFLASVFAKKTL